MSNDGIIKNATHQLSLVPRYLMALWRHDAGVGHDVEILSMWHSWISDVRYHKQYHMPRCLHCHSYLDASLLQSNVIGACGRSGHQQAAHERQHCIDESGVPDACRVVCMDWLTSLPWINTASRVRLTEARGDEVGFRDATACRLCAVHATLVIQNIVCCVVPSTSHTHPHACATVPHANRECALQIVDN